MSDQSSLQLDESSHDGIQDETKANEENSKTDGSSEEPMLDTFFVNRMFRTAADMSMAIFLGLLLLVYTVNHRNELGYLSDSERMAAAIGCATSLLSAALIMVTFMFWQRETGKISGLVYAGLMVMVMSTLTNGLLAFAPTYVKVDRFTQSRVFLVRWCEWIPCAGLMTFLCDAVHVPKSKKALREAVVYSLFQSMSCVFGLVAPYVHGLIQWSILLILSFALYVPIFPRLSYKNKVFRGTPMGKSFAQMERYNRHRFSYQLMLICSTLWTVLVLMYLANAYIHLRLPQGHFFRSHPLAMYTDITFDVLAKSLYMRQIVEAHKLIFHSEGLAQRQLLELRRLMSALWESSSDMIVLSIRHEQKCLTLFSPGFSALLSGSPFNRVQKALVLEIHLGANSLDHALQDNGVTVLKEYDLSLIKNAYFIDSTDFTFDTLQKSGIRHALDPESSEAKIAYRLVHETWSALKIPESKANKLLPCDFDRVDGSTCHCEMKVLPHDEHGMIAVIRDVSERVRRFEAERKAESEALKRQKEAHSQTRFVRHEIKNGLLAGIELIDNVKNALNDFERTVGPMFSGENTLWLPPPDTDAHNDELHSSDVVPFMGIALPSPDDALTPAVHHGDLTNARKRLRELDHNLHDVLDTVLAEAMAREVVSEVYRPRYESTDVLSLLASDRPSRDRFPVRAKQIDFPCLQLDPQLLRYIHRNAVSNACKYGEQGAPVITLVSFDYETRDFVLEVINSPGQGHDMLRSLGSKACDAVFAQGEMLHKDLQINSRFISSGDGAWIAQKCAKAMDGLCTIRFDEDLTVFQFTCSSEPLAAVEKADSSDFEIPPGTVAIGVDDSKIQRRLMSRIFDLVGVEEQNKIIVGENPSDVFELEKIVLHILETRPECKILMFVDENLDYGGQGQEVVVMSGSRVTKDILTALAPEFERRMLALVRSANDATSDLALYMARAHGFFPKAPLNKSRVRAILAPLWADRFQTRREAGEQDERVKMNDEILNRNWSADDTMRPRGANRDDDPCHTLESAAKRRKMGYSNIPTQELTTQVPEAESHIVAHSWSAD